MSGEKTPKTRQQYKQASKALEISSFVNAMPKEIVLSAMSLKDDVKKVPDALSTPPSEELILAIPDNTLPRWQNQQDPQGDQQGIQDTFMDDATQGEDQQDNGHTQRSPKRILEDSLTICSPRFR